MNKYFRYGETGEGYPLIRDWTTQTGVYGNAPAEIFGEGNSVESVFELTYMKNDNMLANGAVDTYYGNLNNTWYNRVSPTQFLYNDVNNNLYKLFVNKYDARYYESMLSSSIIAKYTALTPLVERSTSNDKITSVYSGFYSAGKNHSNWIIYRLTDIMLMKAEALVQMAASDDDPKLEEAFGLVQVVNRRSIMKDPDKILPNDLLKFPADNTKSNMEEMVIDERQRELLFEGKRWFDLVRRSMRDGNNTLSHNRWLTRD